MFNRKIYAYDVVSVQEHAQSLDRSSPSEYLLNNKENPCLSYKCNLPSCHQDLAYVSDSPISNHSFDSVNVNSPSSRGTLDLTMSDCDIFDSNVAASSPTSNILINENGCQSTSQEEETYFKPTMTLNSNNSTISNISTNIGDDGVSTSTIWEDKELTDSCNVSHVIPVCQESQLSPRSVINSSNLSPKRPDELVAQDLSLNCVVSSSSTLTPAVHMESEISLNHTQSLVVSSTSGMGSSIGSSKFSRSCPSPELPSSPNTTPHEELASPSGLGQDATLLAVAARLGVQDEGRECFLFQSSQRNESLSPVCNEELSTPPHTSNNTDAVSSEQGQTSKFILNFVFLYYLLNFIVNDLCL